MKTLKKFNTTTQNYGDFFSGFQWTVIGCLTFRKKVSHQCAEALVKNYIRRLGENLKLRLAYIAVPEHRTSGCGLPSIRLHYHCLMACPIACKPLLYDMATQLWEKMAGNCKIDYYDSSLHGAYYFAKLAAHGNFDWVFGGLDRLTYDGPHDLNAAALSNPYVPAHAKGQQHLTTLVLSSDKAVLSGKNLSSQISDKAGVSVATAYAVPKSKVAAKPSYTKAKHPLPAPPLQSGPTVYLLEHVWREQLKTYFNITGQATLSSEQRGKLKFLRGQLGTATLAVVEYAVGHWAELVQDACPLGQCEMSLTIPSIGFLVLHRRTALFLTHQAVSHKQWKSPRDWCVVKQVAILEPYWGKP